MSPATLLDAAMLYHSYDWPVIPVDQQKAALHKWGFLRERKQTIEEVRDWFARPVYGLALLTWPASDLVTLDFDGPHAEAIWERQVGIQLPQTARTRTRSGGSHNVFRMPSNAPAGELQRRIRLVMDPVCSCPKSCGVDLLLHGYFIVPPTAGYTEDPDSPPLEPGGLALLPLEVLELIGSTNGAEPRASSQREKTDYSELLRGVKGGVEHDSSLKLIGHLLPKLGLEETWAIMEAWSDRCTPPADKRKIRMNCEDIAKREAAKRSSGPEPRILLVTASELLARDYSGYVDVVGGGILPPEGGLILAGPAGVGKSLFALEVALDLANGVPLLGRFEVSRAQRVLILQQELAQAEMQKRLAHMIAGKGWDALVGGVTFNEPGPFPDLENAADQGAMINAITSTQAGVVVLDPLSTFHSRDENDNVRMRRVLGQVTSLCRTAHCAAIVLHHFGKPHTGGNGDDTRHSIRGASSILDWADTALTLTEKRYETLILRRLEFVKIRNGKPLRPLLLKRDPESHLHTIEAEERVLCDPARAAGILADLGGEVPSKAALVTAIINETGSSKPTAYRVIDQAITAGLFEVARGEGTKRRLVLCEKRP